MTHKSVQIWHVSLYKYRFIQILYLAFLFTLFVFVSKSGPTWFPVLHFINKQKLFDRFGKLSEHDLKNITDSKASDNTKIQQSMYLLF